MKILIVDDELVSRAKMKKLMTPYGECDEAKNGIQAMEMISHASKEARGYNLMTLDVNMPGMSGMEVLARVRQMEQGITGNLEKDGKKIIPIKIVMVTSLGDRQTFSQSLFSGCDDYIIKPFNPEIIHSQMRILGFSSL